METVAHRRQGCHIKMTSRSVVRQLKNRAGRTGVGSLSFMRRLERQWVTYDESHARCDCQPKRRSQQSDHASAALMLQQRHLFWIYSEAIGLVDLVLPASRVAREKCGGRQKCSRNVPCCQWSAQGSPPTHLDRALEKGLGHPRVCFDVAKRAPVFIVGASVDTSCNHSRNDALQIPTRDTRPLPKNRAALLG